MGKRKRQKTKANEYEAKEPYEQEECYENEDGGWGIGENGENDAEHCDELGDVTLDEYDDQLLMHTKRTLPEECRKFWPRRYDLFSLYDEGVFMTAEMWFSVTPEKLAIFTAKLVKLLLPQAETILDICCGAGGNTIQFAKEFKNVGAIDINERNIYCTIHNCEVYETAENVWTLNEDWNEIQNSREWIPVELQDKEKPFDFIFCSPPWGGVNYNKKQSSFNLDHLQPLAFDSLCASFSKLTTNFGLFLPKSSNFNQLYDMSMKLFNSHRQLRIIQLEDGDYMKGLIVLYGPDMVKAIDYTEFPTEFPVTKRDPLF